ncbi:MAG: O-antigen ligase family protein [Candidatus Sumerlaeia bacterium]|nr:O-antigen ligase family protein [Candidatus Sumerlaeia bacterium]
MLLLGEMYLLLAGLFCAAIYGMFFLAVESPIFLFPIIGALAGLALAFFGGTTLCFTLYFLSTFGTTLAFPFLPISLNRLLAVLLFLAWCIDLARRRQSIHISVCMVSFFAIQVYILIAAAILMPSGVGFVYPIESIFYLLLAMIIALGYQAKRDQMILIGGFIVSTLVMVGIPGLIEVVTRQDLTLTGFKGPLRRLDGLSVNAIVFAFAALYAIPLAFTLFIAARSTISRAFLLGTVLLLVMLSLATLNRQTPIVLGTMGIVYIALVRWPYKRFFVIPIIVGGLLVAPFVGGKLVERLSTATDAMRDPSLAVRSDKAVLAVQFFQQSPWFGIGHDYFQYRWREDLPKGNMLIVPYLWEQYQYIDLGYLQVLTEYGIVGMALFLILMAATLVHMIKYYRVSLTLDDPWYTNLMAALMALFVQFLVTMLVMDSFITTRTFILYGFLFAISGSIRSEFARQHGNLITGTDKKAQQ